MSELTHVKLIILRDGSLEGDSGALAKAYLRCKNLEMNDVPFCG